MTLKTIQPEQGLTDRRTRSSDISKKNEDSKVNSVGNANFRHPHASRYAASLSLAMNPGLTSQLRTLNLAQEEISYETDGAQAFQPSHIVIRVDSPVDEISRSEGALQHNPTPLGHRQPCGVIRANPGAMQFPTWSERWRYQVLPRSAFLTVPSDPIQTNKIAIRAARNQQARRNIDQSSNLSPNSEKSDFTHAAPSAITGSNISGTIQEHLLGATSQKPICLDEDFLSSVVDEKTVFLRCSLRLDMKYDGPDADLKEILNQTLDAMGRYGRDILDRHPLTRGSTLHVCKDVNCELLH